MKLKIKVIPSSSRDCIAGWLDETLRIKVKAPPEKGKANKAVIGVLEKELKLAKGSISIESGTTSVRKTIEINCDDENKLRQRLSSYR